MKKIMISQLMAGKTSEEINKEKELTKQYLDTHFKKIGEEYEIINTYFKDEYEELVKSSQYTENEMRIKMLAKSIDAMSGVDILCMVGNWFAGAGCQIEYAIANSYNIDLLYVEFELGTVFTKNELFETIDGVEKDA